MTHGVVEGEMMALGKKIVLQYFFKVSDSHFAGRSYRRRCLTLEQSQL